MCRSCPALSFKFYVTTGKAFESMPNFRKLCPEEKDLSYNSLSAENNSKSSADATNITSKVYRSSKPDFLTEQEVEQFNALNIQSIIDFRSYSEYKRSHHKSIKLLDKQYALFKVEVPQWSTYKQHEIVVCKKVSGASDNNCRKHYLINFFNYNYVWEVFNRVPILMRIVSLFYLLIDFILRNDKRYFVRFFAKQTLNQQGIVGQYIDFVTHSQASICAALKLLCDPANLPVMLNCAYGKDRTGMVSAMILACLGSSKEYICQDYARSAVELKPVEEILVDDVVGKYHLCRTFTSAESHNMMRVLEYIEEKHLVEIFFKVLFAKIMSVVVLKQKGEIQDIGDHRSPQNRTVLMHPHWRYERYGSICGYLEKIGLSIQEQQVLRNNLLS
ncbi:hypothetical protein HELRODRAFT_193253 [Helobdella robusta]|uniref:Tyrosine specific protein phosphatases domain-containing protein n=1 Tax=Helobdella robusta TaxID=6412 RepID=T1FUS8_HELRO|nr:hypothetical protein HELRODRAFT_193253 [Helobdella robusta]ESN97615.1 hypothetical protein HELRODRAFT_193253 [Helobdella robusta]